MATDPRHGAGPSCPISELTSSRLGLPTLMDAYEWRNWAPTSSTNTALEPSRCLQPECKTYAGCSPPHACEFDLLCIRITVEQSGIWPDSNADGAHLRPTLRPTSA